MNGAQETELSRFDAMTPRELEDFLRQDACSAWDESHDAQTILYVTELLTKKKRAGHSRAAAKRSWRRFSNKFLKPENPRRNSFAAAKRKNVVLAAMLLLLTIATSTVFAKALSDYPIAYWTDTVLRFAVRQQPETKPTEHHCLFDQQPKWLPEGFAAETLELKKVAEKTVYSAYYSGGEAYIQLTAISILGNSGAAYPKDADEVEIWYINDKEYYVFYNMDLLTVAWVEAGYSCCMSGTVSRETMEQILMDM